MQKDKGVLIYANNNEVTDYEYIARANAERIRKLTGLDTHIITTGAVRGGIRSFGGKVQPWFNGSRPSAYNDTPFAKTVLIDADYIISSDQIMKLFDHDKDFLLHTDAYDITGRNALSGHRTFGELGTPMAWATVVYFTQSEFAKQVFIMVEHIFKKWELFAELYKFKKHPYRNDFAFTIAVMTVSGHRPITDHAIPWPLMTVPIDCDVAYDQYSCKITTDRKTIKVNDIDCHVMNKESLCKTL